MIVFYTHETYYIFDSMFIVAYTTLEQTLDGPTNHTTTTTNDNEKKKDKEKESSVENKRLKPSNDHESESTPKRKLLRTE